MSMTGTFREGWLYKLGWINIHRTWRRRYFVLKGDELHYYKKPEDNKPAGIIELRHYRKVKLLPVKQSSWAFRIESGCSHHWNQQLYAENDADSQIWMESIQEQLDKQLSVQHRCSSRFHPPVLDDDGDQYAKRASANSVATAASGNADDSSVLDKWLERLDLQEETPLSPSPKLAVTINGEAERASSSPSSSSFRQRRPLSLDSLGYQSTDSLDTITSTGPLSSVFSDMSSSTSTTATVAAAAGGGTSTTGGVKSNVMLGNASVPARIVRRRMTTSEQRCNTSDTLTLSTSPPSSPSSPQSLHTGTQRCRGTEWSSVVDLFHYMQDDVSASRNTRYSMEFIPPRSLPAPTSPLPPTPQQVLTTVTSVAAIPPSTINNRPRYNLCGRRFSAYSSARY